MDYFKRNITIFSILIAWIFSVHVHAEHIHVYYWDEVQEADYYEGIIWNETGSRIFQTSRPYIHLKTRAAVFVKAYTANGIAFIKEINVKYVTSDKSKNLEMLFPSRQVMPPPGFRSPNQDGQEIDEDSWDESQEIAQEIEAIRELEEEQKIAFDHAPFRNIRILSGLGTENLSITAENVEFSGNNGHFSLEFEFDSEINKFWKFETQHRFHDFNIKQQVPTSSDSTVITKETMNHKGHSFSFLYHWYVHWILGLDYTTYPELKVINSNTGALSLSESYQLGFLTGFKWHKVAFEGFSYDFISQIAVGQSSLQNLSVGFQGLYSLPLQGSLIVSLTHHQLKNTSKIGCNDGSSISICNLPSKGSSQFSEFQVGIGFQF